VVTPIVGDDVDRTEELVAVAVVVVLVLPETLRLSGVGGIDGLAFELRSTVLL
jgi:hypothetical protein